MLAAHLPGPRDDRSNAASPRSPKRKLEHSLDHNLKNFAPPNLSRASKRSSAPLQQPLPWAEARQHELLSQAESFHKHTGAPTPKQTEATLRTTTRNCFRWMQRITEGSVRVVAVDGDVSSVYPGVSNEQLVNNVNCLADVFPRSTHEDVADFLGRALAGQPLAKTVFTWHTVRRFNVVVQVSINWTQRYWNEDGTLVAVQVGETRDVTETMREQEALVSDIIVRSRETVDHRFGNKIRMLSLLAENGCKPEELVSHFERLRYEIEIRRNCLVNLPSIVAVAARDFFESEFIKLRLKISYDDGGNHLDATTTPPKLLFYDLSPNRKAIHPIVLQVLIIQDLASNAFKHGCGDVELIVSRSGVEFRNEIAVEVEPHKDPVTMSPRRRIGLEAMRSSCSQLNCDIQFSREGTHFVSRLDIDIDFIFEPGDNGAASLSREHEDEPALPQHGKVENMKLTAQQYQWIFVDDEPLICTLFKRLAMSRYNIDVRIVQSPSQVANLLRTLVDVYRTSCGQPIVLIMDEFLVEMTDDNFRNVSITGTQLRDRIFNNPVTKALVEDAKIFLISASASQVQDDRVLLKLGKNNAVTSEIAEALRAVKRRVAAKSRAGVAPGSMTSS